MQELPEATEWKVLAFYFKDSFLREVIEEYRQYLPSKNPPESPVDMLMEINTTETSQALFYSIRLYLTHKLPVPESLLELKFKELLFNTFLDPANKNVLAYGNSLMYIPPPYSGGDGEKLYVQPDC